MKPEYHGRLLRISGVVRSVRRDIPGREELLLDCGRVRVPVDISACPAVADGAEVGSCVEVTGVCVMDIENRRSRTHFPETDGFLVVLRTAEDMRIVARPPWWTPARLLVVILSLVGVLVGFAVWVRVLNRLVERRVDVRGSVKDGRLEMSVKDDGSGFDPAKRPGMAEGHFGLSGVEERLRRLGGKLKIVSAPGKGTEMEVTIG